VRSLSIQNREVNKDYESIRNALPYSKNEKFLFLFDVLCNGFYFETLLSKIRLQAKHNAANFM